MYCYRYLNTAHFIFLRETQLKRRPFSLRRNNIQYYVVQFQDAIYQRKADTRTTDMNVLRTAIKGLKNQLYIFGWDTRTVIRNFHVMFSRQIETNFYFYFFILRKLAPVVHQVLESRTQQWFVTVYTQLVFTFRQAIYIEGDMVAAGQPWFAA